MTDHHDGAQRLARLMLLVFQGFDLLREALLHLPVPIRVSGFTQPQDPKDAKAVQAAFDRTMADLDTARVLIEDEPLTQAEKSAANAFILDWMAAVEMMIIARVTGPARWRLDIIHLALTRMERGMRVLDGWEPDDPADER